MLREREGIRTRAAGSGVGRNRFWEGAAHGRMTVGLMEGIRATSAASALLAPRLWREPDV